MSPFANAAQPATRTAPLQINGKPDVPVNTEIGLTSEDAGRRLELFGPNAVADTSSSPFRMALEKFWAPVPWRLKAALVLEIALGKYVASAVIAGADTRVGGHARCRGRLRVFGRCGERAVFGRLGIA
jgi:H+-transporting ATPase